MSLKGKYVEQQLGEQQAVDQQSSSWMSNKLYLFLKHSDITSPIRNSSYPVKTIIENPVLAWFNLCGKIALLVYLLFMFVHESLYYKLSIPKVHVDYYAERLTNTSYNVDDYVYCNNETYDFVYSANWLYTNNKCTWLEYSETYKKGDRNFFFFTTYFQETTRALRRNCTPSDDIFNDLGLSYDNCIFTPSGSDTICECEISQNYFVLAAENSLFGFTLSYFVSDTQQHGGTGDSDVRIAILGPDGDVYRKVSNAV
jgi:hypothetical protein